MRRSLIVAAMLTLVLGAAPLIGVSGPPEVLPMTIDPDSGPPGTVITVEGEGCDDSNATKVTLRLFKMFPEPFSEVVAFGETPATDTGDWETTVTVPDDAEPGDYEMHGSCQQDSEPDENDPEYEPQPFEVTALPAEPVEEEPTFTG